jgi:hypothetical protein
MPNRQSLRVVLQLRVDLWRIHLVLTGVFVKADSADIETAYRRACAALEMTA